MAVRQAHGRLSKATVRWVRRQLMSAWGQGTRCSSAHSHEKAWVRGQGPTCLRPDWPTPPGAWRSHAHEVQGEACQPPLVPSTLGCEAQEVLPT